MKNSKDPLPALLASTSRTELRAKLAGGVPLSLPQAQKLQAHLRGLIEPTRPLRVGVVHTYTSDLLDPWLHLEASLQGLALDLYHAPYGVTLQEARPGSALDAFAPDLTLLLLRWEDLHPQLAQPLAVLDAAGRAQLADAAVEHLAALLGQLRATVGGHLLLSLLPALTTPGLGHFDATAEASEAAWRAAAKARIAARLRDAVPGSSLLDLDEVLLQLGREQFFDARFWYSARFPFAPRAARELARRVAAVGAVQQHPKAKVLVLDADNTLWGGIIGEDGRDGIALGPDYPGNCYVDFQRRLLDYQQRGFLLALCSKNNPDDALEVLRSHPHQLLRESHFAAMRINWEPKPHNLRSLAEELNLGLDSFVFVDDSHHECMAVRTELPQVEVVQTPSRPVDVPHCLERVARLEVLSLTSEDRDKTRMYVQERQRKELAATSADPAAYLASLQMRMRIGVDDAAPLSRLAQLTQKTNQFNLTTRRYDEVEVARRIAAPDWLVAHFSLADIFGDSGIVGLAMIAVEGDTALLDSFLMSCRVIGREAESAFLEALLRVLQARGVVRLYAEYLPTAKNKLVENFLPEHGFTQQPDGRWLRDLAAPIAAAQMRPIAVELADGMNTTTTQEPPP